MRELPHIPMRVVVSDLPHPAPLHVKTALIPHVLGGEGCCDGCGGSFGFAMCLRSVGGGEIMLAEDPVRKIEREDGTNTLLGCDD